MPFRDQTETLRARIEVLESELAVVREENARLKGEKPSLAGAVASRPHWLFGVPTKLTIRRDFGGTPTAACVRATKEVLEQRFGQDSRLMTFDNDLWFKAGATDFTMTPGDGITRIELSENHGWVALPAWLFIAFATYLACFVASAKLDPAMGFAIALPISLVVTALVARLWVRRYLRGVDRRTYGTFESLSSAVTDHLDTTSKRKVRIGADPLEEEAPASSAAPARAVAR